jgi:hypothetical protein
MNLREGQTMDKETRDGNRIRGVLYLAIDPPRMNLLRVQKSPEMLYSYD